jgi:hypothetical protein
LDRDGTRIGVSRFRIDKLDAGPGGHHGCMTIPAETIFADDEAGLKQESATVMNGRGYRN